jgi:hypothetical protein
MTEPLAFFFGVKFWAFFYIPGPKSSVLIRGNLGFLEGGFPNVDFHSVTSVFSLSL